jgi:acetylornithine deacetylase/succinyl-diaminopimelate desuccinylase-like protein
LEGEEEVSSQHLEEFVKNHSNLLQSDSCIWEFGGVDHTDTPVEYLGLRGICYVQLDVKTANQDVHSGLGGSIFPNAAWHLVWALNSLKDENDHIRIPGFYDKVRKPSERDRELMSKLPETAVEYQTRYEIKNFIKGLTGGVDLRLAEVFEPTCTICGITSGYQGLGSKTVLPAQASAKIDFRLVPDQKPEDVLKQLRDYLDSGGFKDIDITYLGGEAPSRTDPDDPFIQLIVDTAIDVYGKPMQIMPMTGGSGPNYIIQEALQIPIATLGIGYPEGNAHSPYENIRLNDYLKAARHLVRILDAFGRI